jgi:hypothetical protein
VVSSAAGCDGAVWAMADEESEASADNTALANRVRWAIMKLP